MTSGALIGAAYTQSANAADHTIRIAPLRLELAPGKTIDTFAYNGAAQPAMTASRISTSRGTIPEAFENRTAAASSSRASESQDMAIER
jgi:hypothetical protein